MICYIVNIWFGADFEYESNLGCIPNVVRGTNRIIHNVIPSIIPDAIPCIELYGVILCQNNAICPNISSSHSS